MRDLVRQNRRFFILFALLGTALRLMFVYRFPHYAGDSLIYADIAQNWLRHGTYSLTENAVPAPTLIRLPGYPSFLAILFKLFGSSPANISSVLLVQTFVDLAGCFVIAAIGLELFTARVASWTFALAAMCPFTANYVALPMTETLAIFFAALAFLFSAKALRRLQAGTPSYAMWAGCGVALAAGTLLRPDGGILLAALLLFLFLKTFSNKNNARQIVVAGALLCFFSLAPLLPWTMRNWRVFHVFQPLAPRYANAPDEYVPLGFNRWVKTWLVEYASVEDVFWNVSTETPGEAVSVDSLPDRAFDSPGERARVASLFSEFNQTLVMRPNTDAEFARLASDRIRRAPFRYYVMLPALRIIDMWLRPRTEMLPLDQHWWTFDDPPESWFSIAYGGLNLLLVAAGLMGLAKFRNVRIYGLMVGFILLRSLFLSTMENPEPRYMLECFPVVLVMAAAVCAHAVKTQHKGAKAQRGTKKIE